MICPVCGKNSVACESNTHLCFDCYQKCKQKTPEDMLLDGWCKDCDQDITECMNLGYCKGEQNE